MDFRREPSGIENGFEALDEVSYNYLKNSDALIRLPIERLRKMNPGAISLYSDHGIDITREPLRVAVCAQHNNGGIRIDSHWQTNIKGLYAAGEAAGSLGIFRPGGSALNSCQVGSLRAAEHIAFMSDNTPSDNFDLIKDAAEANALLLIERCRGEKSTLAQQNLKYSSRMSKCFAFLRDIELMREAKREIGKDLESFISDNKWSGYHELFMLFKNLDIIRMQNAVAEVISYTAEHFGSRGSGFVLNGTDFMQRQPLPENTEGREKIVTLKKENGRLTIECLPTRPIPTERDLWFEKVWGKFRALRERSAGKGE